MQTPQAFRLSVLREAYRLAAGDKDFQASDDCGVVLRYLPDVPIVTVLGAEHNLKVTHPVDLFTQVFSRPNFALLVYLFAPVLFLPLMAFLIGIPLLILGGTLAWLYMPSTTLAPSGVVFGGAVDEKGIFKSSDGGKTWAQRMTGFRVQTIFAMATW